MTFADEMLESIFPRGSSLRKDKILSLGLLEPDCSGAGSHALRYSAKQVALHSELKKISLFFKITRKEKKGGGDITPLFRAQVVIRKEKVGVHLSCAFLWLPR